MKRCWYRAVLRRRIFVIFLLLIQVAFLAYVLRDESPVAAVLSTCFKVSGIFFALKVIYEPRNGSLKTGWILLLLVFPVAGTLLFLLVHFQSSTRRFLQKLEVIDNKDAPSYMLHKDSLDKALCDWPEYASEFHYLQDQMHFPIYDDSDTTYLSPGEEFLPVLLNDLKKAESYIFLEYFIIQEGKMWNAILDVLKQKVSEGVDVRVMYDDVGCFVKLPKNYKKTLEAMGINCLVFNPFRPVLTAIQNNRDHRKVVSIDGKIAYTGGLNLADEYINAHQIHGHWKDCALRVEGKAAWSLTLIFLELWQLCSKETEDTTIFFPQEYVPPKSHGYVQPYADSPMDGENVGEQIYLQMIYGAKKTLYITTPYLIVDDRMISALCLAAKSGVDVRIITPHIADHALVSVVTRSFYRTLISNGVKLYEYSLGFIHSKFFIADGKAAAVGTINLDFRSLYMHFECGTFLCGTPSIESIETDFLNTLDNCQQIMLQDCKSNLPIRLFQELLRLFAPLM